jgi:ABC-2 type transport system permease protein
MSAHAHSQPQIPGEATKSGHHGPSALGDDLRRFVNLTLMLAITDFKLRYFGSALGYLWSLIRPLLFFGVLYIVFTKIVRLGDQVPYYPVYLLTSIVLWTFFAETTNASVRCLVDRENLLRKIRFPRLVIPLATVLTSLFNLGLNLVVVIIFAMLSGVTPHAGWLEIPFLVGFLALLATGVGMLLSALFVRFRDIQPIWDVTLQVLFYGSPILYVASNYPDNIVRLASTNPLAVVFSQMRKALIDPSAPSAATYVGGPARLLFPIAIVFGIFVLGYWVFSREAPRIAENL